MSKETTGMTKSVEYSELEEEATHPNRISDTRVETTTAVPKTNEQHHSAQPSIPTDVASPARVVNTANEEEATKEGISKKRSSTSISKKVKRAKTSQTYHEKNKFNKMVPDNNLQSITTFLSLNANLRKMNQTLIQELARHGVNYHDQIIPTTTTKQIPLELFHAMGLQRTAFKAKERNRSRSNDTTSSNDNNTTTLDRNIKKYSSSELLLKRRASQTMHPMYMSKERESYSRSDASLKPATLKEIKLARNREKCCKQRQQENILQHKKTQSIATFLSLNAGLRRRNNALIQELARNGVNHHQSIISTVTMPSELFEKIPSQISSMYMNKERETKSFMASSTPLLNKVCTIPPCWQTSYYSGPFRQAMEQNQTQQGAAASTMLPGMSKPHAISNMMSNQKPKLVSRIINEGVGGHVAIPSATQEKGIKTCFQVLLVVHILLVITLISTTLTQGGNMHYKDL